MTCDLLHYAQIVPEEFIYIYLYIYIEIDNETFVVKLIMHIFIGFTDRPLNVDRGFIFLNPQKISKTPSYLINAHFHVYIGPILSRGVPSKVQKHSCPRK